MWAGRRVRDCASRLGRIVDPKGLCVNLRVPGESSHAPPSQRAGDERQTALVAVMTSSGSGLRATATEFVFARSSTAEASDGNARERVELADASALAGEFRALGLVSDDDDDDVYGDDARERAGFGVGVGAGGATEAGTAMFDGGFGGEESAGGVSFEDALVFLASVFPDYDSSCLEEALINTGGDVELAMELLMDDEVPEEVPPNFEDDDAFPSLAGGSSAAPTSAPEPEPLPKKIYLSGGMSNINRASAASLWSSSVQQKGSQAAKPANKLERGPGDGAKTKIEWVETGAAVSQLYTANRDEARDYARVRNVCYEQATNAFLSGNKALAKELSRQGREAAAKMSEAHEGAAHSIYQSRGGGQDGVIDLHGLHAAEAIKLLRHELDRLRSSGYHSAQVLVGTGHHTIGSRTPARLPVAVENFLHQERWSFSEPQAGHLEVRLY